MFWFRKKDKYKICKNCIHLGVISWGTGQSLHCQRNIEMEYIGKKTKLTKTCKYFEEE